MPTKVKYQKNVVKAQRPTKRIALYTFLGLSALAISAFLIQRSTYFAPSAREVNNLPEQKLEAESYIKYLNQYGLPKTDIDNYKLGETNIQVYAKATTNDQSYLPKLKLYVNGVTRPYFDIKTVPASNSFSTIEWNIPYLIKEGDEISVEYFNDTEANRDKNVYIDNIQINDRKFYLTSTDNRVWYDRANTNEGFDNKSLLAADGICASSYNQTASGTTNNCYGKPYSGQPDFGTAFDYKEVLRFGDYLNFKSGGFNGDMYWNGAIHVQYRMDQNTYPQYKAEYLRDKNKNRFFDDPGLMTRNGKGSCVLTHGLVKCSELSFDWKYSSPDDRYDRIPGDFFLARYTVSKYFYPGKYKFSFLVDDGIRFYLDNKLLIDKYNVESGPRLSEVTVDLSKGNHNLKIEYLENTEQASLKFDITPVSIDQSQLSEDEKLELLYKPYESYDELDDSDGDGLLNIFEMSQLLLKTKPDLFDTDGNGTSDAYEDTDNDGLLNILEQKYHTNPLEADTDLDGIDDVDEIYKYKTDPLKYDTDSDGLNDGFEVTHNLNPNSKDSNNNGKSDANEIISFTKQDGITKTRVDITAEAILSEELKFEEQNPAYTAGGAEKTMLKIIDIVNPNNRQIQNVKVSLGYDDEIISKTKSKTPDKLKIVYLNDQANNITPLDNQSIDKTQKTVSGTVTHLSMFVLIDQDTWDDIFASDFVPSIRGSNGKLNVVFAIDDSTSMKDNDPKGNRISAPVDLVDGLKNDDKSGVIVFNYTPTVIQDLTSNKDTVKAKLIPANLKYDGESNLSAAIRRGVEILRGDSNNETSRILIALTDGVLDDRKSLENEVNLAVEHNVRIYTIGLGNGVDDNLLKDVARDTGGKYYKIANAEQILSIYGDIRNLGKDSDNDGLSDLLENNGIRTCTMGLIYTSVTKSDSDNDTIPDGKEVGSYDSVRKCYAIKSNPLKADSDGDDFNDNIEQVKGTDPTKFSNDLLRFINDIDTLEKLGYSDKEIVGMVFRILEPEDYWDYAAPETARYKPTNKGVPIQACDGKQENFTKCLTTYNAISDILNMFSCNTKIGCSNDKATFFTNSYKNNDKLNIKHLFAGLSIKYFPTQSGLYTFISETISGTKLNIRSRSYIGDLGAELLNASIALSQNSSDASAVAKAYHKGLIEKGDLDGDIDSVSLAANFLNNDRLKNSLVKYYKIDNEQYNSRYEIFLEKELKNKDAMVKNEIARHIRAFALSKSALDSFDFLAPFYTLPIVPINNDIKQQIENHTYDITDMFYSEFK